MLKRKNDQEEAAHVAGQVSTISNGMVISGDVESSGDIRIDGKVEGNIFCKGKVVLGAAGIVEGDLNAANADVFGTIKGNAIVKDMLALKSKCLINGNLTVGRLNIEPEAVFNGQCQMSEGKAKNGAVAQAKAILANQN